MLNYNYKKKKRLNCRAGLQKKKKRFFLKERVMYHEILINEMHLNAGHWI